MSAFCPRKLTFFMPDMKKFHFRGIHNEPIIQASVPLPGWALRGCAARRNAQMKAATIRHKVTLHCTDT